MLDKSLPFYDILMHRPAGAPIKRFKLPPGYSFCMFTFGDEADWARIEASVLEFDDAVEALIYFCDERLHYLRELELRCMFVKTSGGEKVATASAWWNYTRKRRDPWLHWVAVKPEHQGKGLGKAIVGETLHLMKAIEGDRDYYLHTQTWSHRAVEIYEKAGFVITKERGLGGYRNDQYEAALQVLNEVRKQCSY